MNRSDMNQNKHCYLSCKSLDSYWSPTLARLGFGLESCTVGIGLRIVLRHAGLGLDSDSDGLGNPRS